MSTEVKGRYDFDFMIGEWKINNRRLKERLNNCEEWEEFQADYVNHPLLLGYGNMDQFNATFKGKEFEGFSLRLLIPETGEWKIYWIATTSLEITDPVVGKFEGNRGEFFANEKWNDQDMLVRFLWLDVDTETPRWEQAFSLDEGDTWETNWIMEFSRKINIV